MPKKNAPVLVKNDPWLEPYEGEITDRIERFETRKKELIATYGSVRDFASGYDYLGFNYDRKKKGWWYREWAPAAEQLSLIGEFNQWDREATPMTRNEGDIWEVFLPDSDHKASLTHGSMVKVHVRTPHGGMDRIPAYARYVTQDEKTYDFTARLWNPDKPYQWKVKNFSGKEAYEAPYIYECHVGMAQEKAGLGTYKEFADNILPKIHEQGYNAIQVMAIQEHPYYGSFGYHVSNFFAPSSRFGTPYDLKYLIDKAHELGIAVIMDIVHSHAVKNLAEGLNEFDGSDDQYFHPGGRGVHSQWDSKLFNYGKEEVLRFLLSNVKYWIEEFKIDGFRYDGVTSMLYFHHGDVSFDHYEKYFRDVDWDVLTYFQLANTLIKELNPHALSIAEDMSGMPGLCRPVSEGGMGFDFRLGMGIPDYWIKLLKHKQDEEWNIHDMWGTLTNRRFGERTIAYAESHDQALVGDKSIAFWLMDKEMYSHMHKDHDSLIIDRGIALHKMIRLFTLALGGEGWLNFIGNEFGHPEWVDFPREGNDWSYQYARRQWSLQEHPDLRYQHLYNFGKDMVNTARNNGLVEALPARQLNMDEQNQTLIFERNNLIFAFNFSPTNAVPDYRFRVPKAGKYQVILNSDRGEYGGHDRIDDEMSYPTVTLFGEHFLSIYLPNRVALVLKRKD
ncbi:alpha amylase C-terminal domain-containing protein [Marinoscillum furvescens]|uniref:1,4-alpha-glucan branching enzyme n=1 Tax=Marinoscillum furvescens DSM 4134 TaxID=1122208 RepID=A0A3D9L6M8_MARFU|nr:alpha amylase C-terminal domain-containing protein [Marinoscillum furvescens]REE00560.1 1,4-alpha-glucan branching enzyme [Marinoscillum furvescens DSM 4134]